MPTLFQIIIGAEAGKAIATIKEVQKALGDLGNSTTKVSSQFANMGQVNSRLTQSFSELQSKYGTFGAIIQKISDSFASAVPQVTNIASGLNGVARAASLLTFGTVNPYTALAAAIAAVGTAIIGAGDHFKVMVNRISAMTGSVDAANSAMKSITQIALDTGMSIDSVAQLWARAAGTMQALGYTQKDVETVIRTVAVAISAQAGSTEEATATMIQFSQALASGTLRGDEFRSVMEQAPLLAKLIADNWDNVNGTFGVSVLQLRQMAEAGEITTDRIVKAFNRAAPQVIQMQEEMSNRLSVQWNRLVEGTKGYLAGLDRVYGVTNATTKIVKLFADVMEWAAKDTREYADRLDEAAGKSNKLSSKLKELDAAQQGMSATTKKLASDMNTAMEAVDKAVSKVNERMGVLTSQWNALSESQKSALTGSMTILQTQSEQTLTILNITANRLKDTISSVPEYYKQLYAVQSANIEKIASAQLASAARLSSIEKEQAAVSANTAVERAAKIKAIENNLSTEIYNIRVQAFNKYKALYDDLTNKAEQHYNKIQQLENQRESITKNIEDAIQKIKEKSMSDEDKLYSQRQRAAEMFEQARLLATQGYYDKARELLEQVINKYTEIGQKAQAGSYEESEAVRQLEAARKEYVNILDAQKQKESEAYLAAREGAESALNKINELHTELQEVGKELSKEFKVRIDLDDEQMRVMEAKIKEFLKDRDMLINLKLDLQSAQAYLAQQVEKIKLGDIDVNLKGNLEKLKESLNEAKELAGKYDIDLKLKIQGVESEVKAAGEQLDRLNNIKTESQHLIKTNADAAKREIQSLDGMNTSSTHTIYVKRVEEKAAGGIIDALRFARGGWVPGVGSSDTVPALLPPGSFVIRKTVASRLSGWLKKLVGLGNIITGWSGAASSKMVKALLTPGEYVIPPTVVRTIGVKTLYAINSGALRPNFVNGTPALAEGGQIVRLSAEQIDEVAKQLFMGINIAQRDVVMNDKVLMGIARLLAALKLAGYNIDSLYRQFVNYGDVIGWYTKYATRMDPWAEYKPRYQAIMESKYSELKSSILTGVPYDLFKRFVENPPINFRGYWDIPAGGFSSGGLVAGYATGGIVGDAGSIGTPQPATIRSTTSVTNTGDPAISTGISRMIDILSRIEQLLARALNVQIDARGLASVVLKGLQEAGVAVR